MCNHQGWDQIQFSIKYKYKYSADIQIQIQINIRQAILNHIQIQVNILESNTTTNKSAKPREGRGGRHHSGNQ